MFVRWFTLYFTLLCFGCNTIPPKHMQAFQDAHSAFEAGDYRQSIILYEQLLDHGVRSGAVYYNFGNTLVKANEPVRAVAAYYLARRYIPNDPHLNSNLHAVLRSNGGTLSPPDNSLICFLFFWQNWIGFHSKIWGSLVLSTLSLLCGTSYLFHKSRGLKRCLIGVTILAVIAFASTGYDWYRFEGVTQVVVTTNTLPRKGNSEAYEPTLDSQIPFGTLAVVLDERSNWCLLRFSNSQEGWIPCSHTAPLSR